jgi:hypothetical protein
VSVVLARGGVACVRLGCFALPLACFMGSGVHLVSCAV